MLELLILAVSISLIILGITLIVIAFLRGLRGKVRVSHGGFILLGPIPIVWGSSEKIAKYMLIAALIILVVMVILEFVVWFKNIGCW